MTGTIRPLRLRSLCTMIPALIAMSFTFPAQAARSVQIRVLGHRTTIADDDLDRRIAADRDHVSEQPRERMHRFDLVRSLMAAERYEEALVAAREWRRIDAYNLVVVRLLGDIHSALGDPRSARRSYSAVSEMLPTDPRAQRAVATVLAQQGDLPAAHERMRVAVALQPDDARLRFELADIAQRSGKTDEATTSFETILADPQTPVAVRYPAKQRLAQLYGQKRRDATRAGDRERAETWAAAITKLGVSGGVENDLKIYLSWDTDRTDIDLWVRTPSGETIKYDHPRGRRGEALYDDVTRGYGPESFTAPKLVDGRYVITVHYFGTSRRNFAEARGHVTIVLDEGRESERQRSLPYTIVQRGQALDVAAVEVGETR